MIGLVGFFVAIIYLASVLSERHVFLSDVLVNVGVWFGYGFLHLFNFLLEADGSLSDGVRDLFSVFIWVWGAVGLVVGLYYLGFAVFAIYEVVQGRKRRELEVE